MASLNRSTAIAFVLRVTAIVALALTAPASQRAHALTVFPSACHVNAAVVGGANDGSSWADAYADLQDALSNPDCTEIWVQAGLYKPSTAGNRAISFQIPPDVGVWGGFAGTENFRFLRDPVANVTILSGDIDSNDINFDGNHIDEDTSDIVGSNSYNVVTMYSYGTPITSSTVLDGFTITGGKANGDAEGRVGGAGLMCMAVGAGNECNPTLRNLHFSGNQAGDDVVDGYGGAMVLVTQNGGTASPTLNWVVFSGNYATAFGGAMAIEPAYAATASPELTDVVFSGNSAPWGGAIMSSVTGATASPILRNVTFSSNTATGTTGGGAMVNWASGQDSITNPTLTNVTFYNNSTGGNGGAMLNHATGLYSSSSPSLTNVTFQQNSAAAGGAMDNQVLGGSGVAAPVLQNVILWGDTAAIGAEVRNEGTATVSISYSDISGDCGSITGAVCGDGNRAADPLLGALHNNGGFTLTLALITGSPAIDAGINAGCPATDQRGGTRPVDGNFNGTATCDMGAVEYQGHLFADVPVLGKEWMEPWIDAFDSAGVTPGCGTGPLI